jgi:hypothetical protein
MTLEPTPRLRWVERAAGSALDDNATMHVLQQWWAPQMPAYMRDPNVGEWKDIELAQDA